MSDIFKQFVVLNPDQHMDSLPVTPDLYQILERDYQGFAGHVLVSAHHFTDTWPSWEVHPNGDEMVVLLSGSAEFRLRTASGDKSVHLDRPGAYVLVPKNTWHTAIISEPAAMLFITPGEGTLNAATPPDAAN